MREVQNGGRPSMFVEDDLDFLKYYSEEQRDKIIKAVMPIFSDTHIKPLIFHGTKGQDKNKD